MMVKGEERERLIGRAIELRRKGLLFGEIGAQLGVSRETARFWCRRSKLADDGIRLARLPDEIRMPALTWKGLLWQWPPVRPPALHLLDEELGVCGKCKLLKKCRRMVAKGQFVGCERPLERELRREG